MHHLTLEQLSFGKLRAILQHFDREKDEELLRRLGTDGDRLNVAFTKELQAQVRGMAFTFHGVEECTVTYPANVYYGEAAAAFAWTLHDFVGGLRRMEHEEDQKLAFHNFIQKLTFNSGDPFQETLFYLKRFSSEQAAYLRAQLEKRA